MHGYAIGLLQHSHAAVEGQEAFYVCPGPNKNGLIIITSNEDTLGTLYQRIDHVPLQPGQVLRLIDDQHLQHRKRISLLHNQFKQISKVQQTAAVLVVPVGAVNKFKVMPLYVKAALVVMLLEVCATYPCEIDLVEYWVVCLEHRHILFLLREGEFNACLKGKLLVVQWLHHVVSVHRQAVKGQAVESAEVREVRLLVQAGELHNCPFLGLGGSFSGERKVANLQ